MTEARREDRKESREEAKQAVQTRRTEGDASKVLQALCNKGPQSAAWIARETQLDPRRVSKALAQCSTLGKVRMAGQRWETVQ